MTLYIRSLIFLLGLTLFFGACKRRTLPVSPAIKPAYIDSSMTDLFRQTQGITAGVGATSLVLNDGRVLWLYGASHLNDYDAGSGKIACNANLHSAGVVQSTSNTFLTLNTGSQDFIPSNQTNTWFTPLHAYQFLDTVFVFCKKEGVVTVPGTYIAKYHFPSMQYIRTDSIPTSSYTFGYSVVSDTATGFCYVFGLNQPNTSTKNNLYVARFLLNNPHSPWIYYNKDTWLNVASGATAITQIPGENFSIRKVRGKYILLTQQAGKACNTGTALYSSIGAEAWGPFNNPVTLHQIGDKLNGITPITFGACLHTAWLNADNEILITYSLDGYSPCVNTCNNGLDNPDFYRQKALRVSLRNIDPSY